MLRKPADMDSARLWYVCVPLGIQDEPAWRGRHQLPHSKDWHEIARRGLKMLLFHSTKKKMPLEDWTSSSFHRGIERGFLSVR